MDVKLCNHINASTQLADIFQGLAVITHAIRHWGEGAYEHNGTRSSSTLITHGTDTLPQTTHFINQWTTWCDLINEKHLLNMQKVSLCMTTVTQMF